MHFYSGAPMHFLSGVDTHRQLPALRRALAEHHARHAVKNA
jgi:hypothetical protein